MGFLKYLLAFLKRNAQVLIIMVDYKCKELCVSGTMDERCAEDVKGEKRVG